MTVVAGFDRSNPPATSTTMPSLRANTNLAWVGDYLASPNHSSTSWAGQLAALSASGWSVSPIYVGQQDPVFAPSTQNRNATSSQGATDGNDAALKAFNEGFAAGTIIYLDVEFPD